MLNHIVNNARFLLGNPGSAAEAVAVGTALVLTASFVMVKAARAVSAGRTDCKTMAFLLAEAFLIAVAVPALCEMRLAAVLPSRSAASAVSIGLTVAAFLAIAAPSVCLLARVNYFKSLIIILLGALAASVSVVAVSTAFDSVSTMLRQMNTIKIEKTKQQNSLETRR